MPITEDEHGTYIMNSKDLRAVEHVQKLVDMGIDCLKIEGRTKSHYYAARTSQIYRQAIDDAVAGKAFNSQLIGMLENLANRGYTDGFYQRHHTHEYQSYLINASKSYQQQFVAEAFNIDLENNFIDVDVKNHFRVGDQLELIIPNADNICFKLTAMHDMKGNEMEVAKGSGYQVRLPIPAIQSKMKIDKILLARFL